MQVVLLGLDLEVVLLTVQVHQIEFVNHAQLLQQLDGAIHGCAVNIGVTFAGQLQQARCVQMGRCLLYGLDQSAALPSQPHCLWLPL